MLPRWMRRMVASASHSRVFGAIGPTVMPPLERAYRVVTRRPGPISELAVPSLVLHTTGARTGLPRRAELICASDASGRTLFVAGSGFARPRHPGWTYNLMAHPAAEVELGHLRTRVTATRLTGAERERAWERLDDVLPGYRRYERPAGREFRVFRLDRIGESAQEQEQEQEQERQAATASGPSRLTIRPTAARPARFAPIVDDDGP